MELPFKSVLDYIRNFFSHPEERDRKRRAAAPVFDVRPKISRFSPYNTQSPRIIPIQRETDNLSPWFPRKTETRQTSPYQSPQRIPMKPIRLDDVVLADDDDVIEIKKPGGLRPECRGKIKSFTSTPADKFRKMGSRNGSENGNDDVVYVKTTKSPKEKSLGEFGFLKSKLNSEKPLFSIGLGALSDSKTRDKSRYSRSSLNNSKGPSALDYSYRLDDKIQYKKLLDQANNDSSQYHTPVGKLFNSYDFFNTSDKKTKSPFTSLFEKSNEKPKETTKERIIKVLDGLENDTVVIKDSDSENSVSVINPPSPKPDIKVDPVNSFKRVVDTSTAAKKDWLDKLVEDHKLKAEERQREIDSLRQCSKETEEINKDINIELLRRKVNACLQLKEAILPDILVETELPKLTEVQHLMVEKAFRGEPNEVLMRKFNLNITRRDLMTLAGFNWLNDEVINFYMNLITERGKDSKWPKSYAFNTFFYTKLVKDGPQSLRRWTKRVDIFSHDFVCIPIHLGMHWCIAIIDFRAKYIRYYDSMGGSNKKCLEALRKYLEAEHLDKKSSKLDTSDWTLKNMEKIPQQMNGSDCGIFSCTFAEFITRRAKITFKQADMPYLRKKMVVEIMSGELLIK